MSSSTFAERVKGATMTTLKRPNCLNLKTKSNLRWHETLELLKEIKFEIRKLVGVAEMKSRSIDITCKTRQNIMELYEKLKQVEAVYNVRLHESDYINVLLGWDPIPMFNDTIRQSIESVFGKAVKITEKKKHKDGLLSGIRILSMRKDELDPNPLPSYIKIDGFELLRDLPRARNYV